MNGRVLILVLMLPAMLLAGAVGADVLPPDVRALAGKLDQAEARMNGLRKRLDGAQSQHKAADARLRALTLMMLKARQYPDGFWLARAVVADQPAASDMLARIARQSAGEVERMGRDADRLRSLYGEANTQLAALQEVRAAYGEGRGRLSDREKQALRAAALKADDLAARLAVVSGDGDGVLEPLDLVSLTAVLAVPDVQTVSAAPTGPRPKLPLEGKVAQGFRAAKGATAEGVVLRAAKGAEVLSMVEGEVLYSGPFRKFGGLVIVKAESGEDILYGGLGSLKVSAGDKVRAGQAVGTLGDDGRLYWEVRRRGRVIDPLALR